MKFYRYDFIRERKREQIKQRESKIWLMERRPMGVVSNAHSRIVLTVMHMMACNCGRLRDSAGLNAKATENLP